MIAQMIAQAIKMFAELEKHDEFFDANARIMKKSFDALVRAGFTEEQATRIIAGQGSGASQS